MALVIADRVKELSTSIGTGVFTLVGAPTGYQTFAVVGNGNTCYYAIVGQGSGEWEVGLGTYATGGLLTRTTVLASSNANAAVTFSAGNKDVFLTHPASVAVLSSAAQTLTNKRITPRITSLSAILSTVADGDNSDQVNITVNTVAPTIAVPSGTPVDGQKLILRIKDSGTAKALAWTGTAGGWRAMGVTLPLTTVISKTLYIGAIYNSAAGFWDVVAVNQEV